MADIFDLFRKIEKEKNPVAGVPEFIVAGLGNPGDAYARTRHNAGFAAVDFLCERYNTECRRAKFHALCGDAVIDGKRILLLKPQTFMNNSGEALREAADFYKIPPEKTVVIYDDVNFDAGVMRIRERGSDGGHNGMKSIIYHLSSDNFPRIRLGVGKKPRADFDLADWVLGKIEGDERAALVSCIEKVPDAVSLIVNGKTQEAMGRFN